MTRPKSMSDAEKYERLMAAFDAMQQVSPSARAHELEVLRERDPTLAQALTELLAADATPYPPLEQAGRSFRHPRGDDLRTLGRRLFGPSGCAEAVPSRRNR